MENTQLFVVAHYFAQPTMGNKVNDALRMLAEATRQEPENISYEFFRSTEDGDRFVILETYRCAEGPSFTGKRNISNVLALALLPRCWRVKR